MKILSHPFLAFAALALMTMPASAALVLSDTFSYPDGDITTAAGSPWTVHSGSTPANIAGGQLRIASGNTADVNAPLAGAPYASNSDAILYASFKIKMTAQPTALGTYFAHFKDTNSGTAAGFGGRIWSSSSNAIANVVLPASKFRLGIANGTAANVGSGQIDQDLDLNTTYFIVTRFVPNTGVATIWLSPTNETDPSVTATDAGTSTRPNSIDVVAYAFRQNGGEGTMLIDDLRVGTTFADVAGTNNPPSLTPIANRTIAASSSTGPLPFTVSDLETPAGGLTLSTASSNPTLVPTNNIVFGGSGSNRTVNVTPVAGQQGTVLITISVTDGNGATAFTSFQISVGLPTISGIANVSALSNTVAGPISFTIGDSETPAGSLSVTGSSSNTNLVPNANITFGGSGSNRTVSIAPAANSNGLTTITIFVNDGTSTASRSFMLTVNPLLGVQAQDNFNYPDGSIVLNSGAWIHHSGTNYGETQTIGGRLLITDARDEDISLELTNRPFDPAGGIVLYASFTVDFTNLPTGGGNYFAHFKDDGAANFRCRVFATRTGAGIGKFRLGITDAATSVSSNNIYPLDLSLNTTNTVVIRHDIGTGQCNLWINPTGETDQNVAASDVGSAITVTTIAFRQSGGIGALFVDDLKVGTAFTDVVAVAPAFPARVARSGSDVIVAWPAAATGFVLQSNVNLSTTNWGNVAQSPTVVGSDKVVTNSASSGNVFFRLKKE